MARPLSPDAWMAADNAIIYADPLGNAVMRIEKI